MALALRLLLLLLLVVALSTRAAQAAPLQAQGADLDGDLDYYEAVVENGLKFLDDVGAEPVGESGAASPPIPITEPLGDAEGVAAGRTSPAPLLVTARKPSTHRRGPPTGRIQDTAGKISLEPYKLKQQMLKEMEQARQNGEAVLKAVFPRESRDSVPASAAGREAMPGTVTGDWDRDMAYMENLVKDSLRNLNRGGGPPGEMNQDREDKKSLEAARHLDQMLSDLERRRAMNQESLQKVAVPERSSGLVPAFTAGGQAVPGTGTGEMLGKSSTNTQNGPSTPRIFCPQDVRRSCMIGTVVTLFTVPFSMVLCYVGFQWWKQKKHAAAAPASRPRRRDSLLSPGSPESVGFGSSQTWPQQQHLPTKAEPQHSVPPPRPPSPAVRQKLPEIPPPPPLPIPPPWSS
nr:uncharacterized protein LOC115491619 isoform X2 [Taeniopygia guttata]